jgi:CubicO group peptidase (beta-lactamase class C family)
MVRVAMLIAAVAAISTDATDAQDSLAVGERLDQVERYVEARLERGRIPGAALAIVQGDSVVHLQTYGIADPTGRRVTPETPFILGSTTKSITAVAITLLVEDGRIDFDASVTEYLPWFRTRDADRSAGITVRHLLYHTSGISGYAGRNPLADRDTNVVALDRFVRSLSRVRLVREPGSAFEYSNANYAVLGRIIQEVSGTTFEEFIENQIFETLNMRGSFTSQSAAEQHGLAIGYRFWFGFPRPAPDMPFARAVAPAGYLISTVGDLARYLTLHLDGGVYGGEHVISSEGMAELHRPAVEMGANISYGMGWVVQTDGEFTTVWHNGGLPNFYSFLGMLPEQQMGVVLLANCLDVLAAGQFDAISLGVIDILRGRDPRVEADAGFHPALNIAAFWALVVLTWQLVWVVASALKRKPWVVLDKHVPVSILVELRKIGLPILLNYGWAICVLSLLPGASGTPFSVMKLYVPDFGFFATVSVVLAIGWGTAQVVLRAGGIAKCRVQNVERTVDQPDTRGT